MHISILYQDTYLFSSIKVSEKSSNQEFEIWIQSYLQNSEGKNKYSFEEMKFWKHDFSIS